MEILSIKGLTKSFGDKRVLDGLDLTIPENSIFGFIGENGAGKTTTMKAILGLIKADQGQIFVCGEKVAYGNTVTNSNVGYLPDVPEFYPYMTAKEYLKLCGECLNMSKKDIEDRTNELLDLVGLADETHQIKGYSRGMKQRLGIAQALFGRPRLLLCDEPTSALDPIGRKEVLDILSRVREQTTVLFSTHILSDIEKICTDVALLNNGKIEIQGPVDQLLKQASTYEFVIEMSDKSSAEIILGKFPDVKLLNDYAIVASNEDKLYEILSFVSCNRLSINKIERKGATIEALFEEVIKK